MEGRFAVLVEVDLGGPVPVLDVVHHLVEVVEADETHRPRAAAVMGGAVPAGQVAMIGGLEIDAAWREIAFGAAGERRADVLEPFLLLGQLQLNPVVAVSHRPILLILAF